jgi:CHAD domain-containing protein
MMGCQINEWLPGPLEGGSSALAAESTASTIMKGPAFVPPIMPVSSTRSELLKKRVHQFQHALNALESGDVRALHRARVASRRLRELAPLLQLDRSKARKIRRRLHKITSRLGPVRELDVLLIQIDELHVSGRRGSGGLGRVGVRVSKARDEARKRLFAELPASRMARFAKKLDRVADGMAVAERSSSKGVARSWRWAIDARVAKRARRLAAAIEDAGAVYLPERLHNVRIALKKLRYAVELSAEAAGRRGDSDLPLLKRAQDLLGRLHDLQMLIEHGRQTQASLAPPSVTIWRELDVLIASLEDDCRRLHGRYMRLRDALIPLAERRGAQTQAASGGPQARRAG